MVDVYSNLMGDGSKIDINEIHPIPLRYYWFNGEAPMSHTDIVKEHYSTLPSNTIFIAVVNRSGGFGFTIGLKTNHSYGFFLLLGYFNSNIEHNLLYNGNWISRTI